MDKGNTLKEDLLPKSATMDRGATPMANPVASDGTVVAVLETDEQRIEREVAERKAKKDNRSTCGDAYCDGCCCFYYSDGTTTGASNGNATVVFG